MTKPKLERCGACGDFTNVSTADELKQYTQEEINQAELVHCGCENYQEPHYITRDMAIDAENLELEGQIYY